MKPKKVQEAPNISPKFYCENCDTRLQDRTRLGGLVDGRWNFCPVCGERIEWEEKRTYYCLPCDSYGQPRGDIVERRMTPEEAARLPFAFDNYMAAVARAMD